MTEAVAVAVDSGAGGGKDVVCEGAGVKVTTLQVAWHGIGEEKGSQNLPVLCCDIRGSRLVTGGGDNCGRVWKWAVTNQGNASCTFVATLAGHEKSVNCVRFSPDGSKIATGGDDGLLLIWGFDEDKTRALTPEECENGSEVWKVEQRISLATDVYDVAWNASGTELATASTDHRACIFAIRETGPSRLCELINHRKYVQGVAFDPRAEWFVTASNDKSVRVFSLFGKNRSRRKMPVLEYDLKKIMNVETAEGPSASGRGGLFHDDTVPTFFRRLAFSPDGSVLVCPTGKALAGCAKNVTNATHVFTRGSLPFPILQLPCGEYPSTAVRFSPLLYKRLDQPCAIDLPYRMIYAVGTTDSHVIVYDTQRTEPVYHVSGIHYEPINDLAWSEDGRTLIVASTDGFCSVIAFDATALGEPVSAEEQKEFLKINIPPEPVAAAPKKAKKEKVETEPTASASAKRDAVTAFFGAVVPKQPDLFVESEAVVDAVDHLKPTVIKKKKEGQ